MLGSPGKITLIVSLEVLVTKVVLRRHNRGGLDDNDQRRCCAVIEEKRELRIFLPEERHELRIFFFMFGHWLFYIR